MNIVKILQRAVQLFPEGPAIRCGREWTSYSTFCRRVTRLAAALRAQGVGKDARVAAILPNNRLFLELYYAAPLAGAILVPLNHRLSPPETAAILTDAEPSLLVADVCFRDGVKEALESARGDFHRVWSGGGGDGYEDFLRSGTPPIPLEESDGIGEDMPAQIYYTSGTTGRPKGVVLTHRNVCFHALMAVAELSLSDRDTWLHAAPMFHLADAWATFAITWVGGRHVMAGAFDPGAILDTIEEDEVTLSNFVPTMLNALVRHPGAMDRAFGSLRLVLSGGAPISPELVRKVMETFKCDYIQTYGLTETSPYLTVSKLKGSLEILPEKERFWYKSSTGRPMIGVELRVVDEKGRDVPADRETVGEIVARGPSVTAGYWRNPEETGNAIREGWFHTGDLAVLDGEGYVNIVDRKKDVIVTGGEQVFSIEVENALQAHPAVREVAVIAVPDEKWGEAVKAVVVREAGRAVTQEELTRFCRGKLARYKAPKSVDFADTLPRTGSKKINKREIREKYWKGYERRVH